MSTSGKARDTGEQVIHYLRKTVNWNDTGIGTADKVKVGTLPKGAFITSCHVRGEVAFNAGTTNVLTVGTNAGADNNIVAAGDFNEASLTTQAAATGLGLSVADDVDVFALYTQTGTAASAGKATIVIGYATDRDG